MNIKTKSIFIGIILFFIIFPIGFLILILGKIIGITIMALILLSQISIWIIKSKNVNNKNKIYINNNYLILTIFLLIFIFMAILIIIFKQYNIIPEVPFVEKGDFFTITIMPLIFYVIYLALHGKYTFLFHGFPKGLSNIQKIAHEKGRDLKYKDMNKAFPKSYAILTRLQFIGSLFFYCLSLAIFGTISLIN
ncbi:hypothetical protein GF327_10320 [Candidatus Woesearchaeota archaeon]|nr:hypothetical protein [Candidatus Woesearchaeota archaeon]